MTARITRRNLKNGLVAFIDLLGFSARVEAISTEAELRALDDDVAFVQAEFEHKSSDELIRKSQKIIYHLESSETGTKVRYTLGPAMDAEGARQEAEEAGVIEFLAAFYPPAFDELEALIRSAD